MSGVSEMRNVWSDDDAVRTAHVRGSTVTLDIGEALELSELLDYLAQWLGIADPAVGADLAAFGCTPGAVQTVREYLVSFSRLLVFGHAPIHPDLDDHGDLDVDGDGPSW